MKDDVVNTILEDIKATKPTKIILHFYGKHSREFEDIKDLPHDIDWLKVRCIERFYEVKITNDQMGSFGSYKVVSFDKVEITPT